jgi:hypothetical protein
MQEEFYDSRIEGEHGAIQGLRDTLNRLAERLAARV